MTPQGFKAFRRAMGWSQAKAAAALGVSTTTIENYERGSRKDGASADIPVSIALACLALYHRLSDVDFEAIEAD